MQPLHSHTTETTHRSRRRRRQGSSATIFLLSLCTPQITAFLAPARRVGAPVGARRRTAPAHAAPELKKRSPSATCDEARAREEADGRALTPAKAAFAAAALALVFLAAEAATAPGADTLIQGYVAKLPAVDPQALLQTVAKQVEDMGPLGAAYFSAVYVTAEILALPAIPLTASAGYLFGAVEGTAIVLFSATIAAGASFLIGRSLLRGWVEKIAGESEQFQAIDRAVASEGFKIILLLRLSPIFPFALSNYFYGLTAVEFGPYLAATLLGFAPGTFLYVYSGELASLVSDSGGAEASYPWYVYALGLAGGALLAGKVTDIATATLEAESGIGKE